MTTRETAPPTAVTAVKAVVLAALLTVLATGIAIGPQATGSHTPATDESPIAWENQHVEQLMIDHRCSVTGFGTEAIPGSALVRVDGGVQLVSFDRGWEVFTGDRAGTLVAVCLDNLPG